jgi:hypothetical protein
MVGGIGDISAMADYILLNTADNKAKKWKQNLMLGGGIRLTYRELPKDA